MGGGEANTANGEGSTVAGGWVNTASGAWSMVAGGQNNTAAGSNAAVVGGSFNLATINGAFVGGGLQNLASGDDATVSGGQYNLASGSGAVVAGGSQNRADGSVSVVGGGLQNFATALYATVPGGFLARATNVGAFVWGGTGSAITTASTNGFSFTVRAVGGVRFITTDIDSTVVSPVPGGLNGVFLAPNSGAWASLSDSNAKTKVTAVDPRRILSKLAAMPVTQWEYKSDPDRRRYIGPMAQDFHAAFGLGYDDKSISTLDSDGVMYAAIQGLVEELKERDTAMAARDKKIDELNAKLKSFEERLRSLPPAP